MERIAYYTFSAFVGALLGFLMVVISISTTTALAAYVGAAALLIVLFDALRTEFNIPNNKRAVGFVLVLFVSAIISTLTSLIVLR